MKQRDIAMIWLILAGVLLGCGAPGVMVSDRSPRWACPSPMPLPYGAAGPVKGYQSCHCTPDPFDPSRQQCEQCAIYYQQWEREYGNHGSRLSAGQAAFSAPFPSPTPYGLEGLSYHFGQIVEIAPLHVQVNARAGVLIGNAQLYHLLVTWYNPNNLPQPVDYLRQLRLRSITAADGAIITGDGWAISDQALQATQSITVPTQISPGQSTIELPVLAPPGTPKTVELRVDTQQVGVVSTPGAALVNNNGRQLVVQWSDARFEIGPACTSDGALTPWQGTAWGQAAPVDLAAPAGSGRLVALALAQVGKPYVWGATGPHAFDCSGLVVWSYAQIGITGLPRTSQAQFARLPSIEPNQSQPGDPVYFTTVSAGASHVGLLVGDVDHDGLMDMVHAESPQGGVRFVSNVFGVPYYRTRLLGVRTLRSWGGQP